MKYIKIFEMKPDELALDGQTQPGGNLHIKEYEDDVIQLKELICDMVARHGTTCQDWDDIGADGKNSIHWLDGYPHM